MKYCPQCRQNFDDAASFCPRDGEVLQESHETLVGQVLDGKYEVEGFIAQGGMGAVYRARHILLGDRVVIKTLRPEMRGNSEWLRRFQREGRAARAFRHPNAVTVYDLSAAGDGLIYMVMEYVEGQTLDGELRARGRFTPAEALELLEPVADVLDAAHERGVVHRDLKPDNIMLSRGENGQPSIKVLDLGIAKMLSAGETSAVEGTSLTVAGQILGTPYYMSPEQWGEAARDGEPEIDGRADVYSLGVITFELVAGRRPLGGNTLQELRRAHVTAQLPSLGDFAPDVPEAFVRAVERAMAKDRGDRQTTAGEFVGELRAALGLAARGHAPSAASGSRVAETDGGRRGAGATPTARGDSVRTAATPEPAETVIDAALQPPAAASETSARTRMIATDGSVAQPPPTAGESPVIIGDESIATAVAAARAPAAAHTLPQAPVAPPARVSKPSRAPLYAGAALVLLVLLGAGAWFAWSRMSAGGPDAAVSETTPKGAAGAAAAKVEALSYWVESYGVSGREAPRRVAEESLTLASGEYFQFHFAPRERGFLYILGPAGNGNARTLFLGARGGGMTKANLVGAGADFAFPCVSCEPDSLQLDRHPGEEDFTVIFSPAPLISPAALTRAGPSELTPEEVKELEDLRARYAAAAPTLSAAGETDNRRAVSVLVPESREAGSPVIFDIRIKHQ